MVVIGKFLNYFKKYKKEEIIKLWKTAITIHHRQKTEQLIELWGIRKDALFYCRGKKNGPKWTEMNRYGP